MRLKAASSWKFASTRPHKPPRLKFPLLFPFRPARDVCLKAEAPEPLRSLESPSPVFPRRGARADWGPRGPLGGALFGLFGSDGLGAFPRADAPRRLRGRALVGPLASGAPPSPFGTLRGLPPLSVSSGARLSPQRRPARAASPFSALSPTQSRAALNSPSSLFESAPPRARASRDALRLAERENIAATPPKRS